jgi:hypothetical protein
MVPVGAAGFEPATSASQTPCASQAALRPAVTAYLSTAGAEEGTLASMAGDARPSPAYYIALGFLAIGLVAGVSLFLLLTARPHSTTARVDVGGPVPTSCTVGGHGTVCYRFMVTNTGGGPVVASCELSAAEGTQATFDDGVTVKTVPVLEGQTRDLTVSVVADQSSTLAEPGLSCSATSA